MSKDEEQLEAAAGLFRGFAVEAGGGLGAALYSQLAPKVAETDELLAFALHTLPGQPAPNMLFAAVQYLLEERADDPLARWYPQLGGELDPSRVDPSPDFEFFCRRNAAAIRGLLGAHRLQLRRPGGGIPCCSRPLLWHSVCWTHLWPRLHLLGLRRFFGALVRRISV